MLSSQGSLNFYKQCHRADKRFQTMGKRCAGNDVCSCRAQELCWQAGSIWSCAAHEEQDQALPLSAHTAAAQRGWGREGARREHRVGPAALRNCTARRQSKTGTQDGREENGRAWGGSCQMCELREHSCIPRETGRERYLGWDKPPKTTNQQKGRAGGQTERLHS